MVNLLQDTILDEIYDLRMDLSKHVGETVPISYRLNVSIINILWTIASGRRMHSQQQGLNSIEFQHIFLTVVVLLDVLVFKNIC